MTEYSLTDPNQRRSLFNRNLIILAHPHGKVVDAQLGELHGGLVPQPMGFPIDLAFLVWFLIVFFVQRAVCSGGL